jgi:hypothetical protein
VLRILAIVVRLPGLLSPERWHREVVGYIIDLVALTLAVLALLKAFDVPLQLGDIAAWFQAVGTIAAVSVALWVAGTEARRHDEDAKRTQAERIAAWGSGFTRDPPGTPRFLQSVVVSNTSAAPIYDVVLEHEYGSGDRADEDIEVHPTFVDMIPPDDWIIAAQQPFPPQKRPHRVAVSIAFTDARGKHWRRAAAGGDIQELQKSALEAYGGRGSVEFVKRPRRVKADMQADP